MWASSTASWLTRLEMVTGHDLASLTKVRSSGRRVSEVGWPMVKSYEPFLKGEYLLRFIHAFLSSTCLIHQQVLGKHLESDHTINTTAL